MARHKFTVQDISEMKDALHVLRKIQERVEDDQKAYAFIDSLMNPIEDAIDEIENMIEQRGE